MNEEYNNIGPSLAKQYKAGLFIDNDAGHIQAMNEACTRGMTTLQVDETHDLKQTPHNSYGAKLYAEMIGEDNTYLRASRKLGAGDGIDLVSGILWHHLPLIDKWMEETKTQTPRAILFDWDRTISVVEGVYVDKDGMHGLHTWMVNNGYDMRDLPDIYVEDALLYLCGGKERLAMLRNIMNACKQFDIDIVFLTNNGGCTPKLINGLRELMDGLMPAGKNYDIMCSMLPPFNGHKDKAFRDGMRERSSLICLAPFGGGCKGRTCKKRRNVGGRGKSKRVSRKSYK
jgi:hypothetical protein